MKANTVWVAINKSDGHFFTNGKQKRAVQAYTSEAKALASVSKFWPRPDMDNIVVVPFVYLPTMTIISDIKPEEITT